MFEYLSHQVTIRGRVAFALAIAEQCMPTLSAYPSGYSLARRALDSAWNWEMNGSLEPEEIDEHIDGEQDDIVVFARFNEEDSVLFAAANLVIFAVGYAANHAYQRVGRVGSMSVQAAECNDQTASDYQQYLEVSLPGDFSVEAARAFVLASCTSQDAREFGAPVDRSSILAAVNAG